MSDEQIREIEILRPLLLHSQVALQTLGSLEARLHKAEYWMDRVVDSGYYVSYRNQWWRQRRWACGNVPQIEAVKLAESLRAQGYRRIRVEVVFRTGRVPHTVSRTNECDCNFTEDVYDLIGAARNYLAREGLGSARARGELEDALARLAEKSRSEEER